MKKKTTELIEKQCKTYQESQKAQLLSDNGGGAFFKQIKNYLSKERPKPFEAMDIYPGQSESEVADLLAAHFNTISNEFTPLDHLTDIPLAALKGVKLL